MSDLRLREDELRWREIDHEVVGVDVRTSTYVSTNTSGGLLWRALATGASRQELVDLIVERYGVAEDRAAGDVDRFLADLRARSLLRE